MPVVAIAGPSRKAGRGGVEARLMMMMMMMMMLMVIVMMMCIIRVITGG